MIQTQKTSILTSAAVGGGLMLQIELLDSIPILREVGSFGILAILAYSYWKKSEKQDSEITRILEDKIGGLEETIKEKDRKLDLKDAEIKELTFRLVTALADKASHNRLSEQK